MTSWQAVPGEQTSDPGKGAALRMVTGTGELPGEQLWSQENSRDIKNRYCENRSQSIRLPESIVAYNRFAILDLQKNPFATDRAQLTADELLLPVPE